MSEMWIAWADQKPKNDKEYLVADVSGYRQGLNSGPIVLAQYDSGYRDGSGMWYWEDGERGYYGDPCRTYCDAKGTFWMPLPEPPKDRA